VALALAAGCEGPEGPAGLTGPPGLTGPAGQDGEDGTDGKDGKGTPLRAYVLQSACKPCHAEIHERWSRSGHAHAMVKVQGKKPDDPPFSAFPAMPPTDDKGKSYGWGDVTYVVGGFAWRALFADAKGYLVTGSQTAHVTKTGQWQAFEQQVAPGTTTLTCAECHTTGYVPADAHEVGFKQDGLEGADGSWVEEGVGCERCHGQGSTHVLAVGYGPIQTDRSSEFCGRCHGKQPAGVIAAEDGLIAQAQQWNEIGSTKMRVVDCADCHDPHQSAHFDDPTVNPDRGVITRCQTCHYDKVGKHKVAKHTQVGGGPDCVSCHMPRAVKVAVGNAALWTGDHRSHLFRVNTDPTAKQLSTDGKQVMPYLTFEWTCRQCHSDKTDKPDALLQTNAAGYHD